MRSFGPTFLDLSPRNTNRAVSQCADNLCGFVLGARVHFAIPERPIVHLSAPTTSLRVRPSASRGGTLRVHRASCNSDLPSPRQSAATWRRSTQAGA